MYGRSTAGLIAQFELDAACEYGPSLSSMYLSLATIPQPIMCRPVSIAVQNRPELSDDVRKCPLVSGLLRKGRGLNARAAPDRMQTAGSLRLLLTALFRSLLSSVRRRFGR